MNGPLHVSSRWPQLLMSTTEPHPQKWLVVDFDIIVIQSCFAGRTAKKM